MLVIREESVSLSQDFKWSWVLPSVLHALQSGLLCVLPHLVPGGFLLLGLDLLLYLGLLVELVEVVDDDGDWQTDAEYTADGTGWMIHLRNSRRSSSASHEAEPRNILCLREFSSPLHRSEEIKQALLDLLSYERFSLFAVIRYILWTLTWTNQLPEPSGWRNISVADRGHCDDSPVQGLG